MHSIHFVHIHPDLDVIKLNARWDEKGMNRKGCVAIPQAHSAWSKRPAIYLKALTLFQVLFMDCPVWIFVISLETEIVQLAESCTWQYFVEKWIFEFLLASPWVLFVCWTTQFPRGIFQTVDLSEVARQCKVEPGRGRHTIRHTIRERSSSSWQPGSKRGKRGTGFHYFFQGHAPSSEFTSGYWTILNAFLMCLLCTGPWDQNKHFLCFIVSDHSGRNGIAEKLSSCLWGRLGRGGHHSGSGSME